MGLPWLYLTRRTTRACACRATEEEERVVRMKEDAVKEKLRVDDTLVKAREEAAKSRDWLRNQQMAVRCCARDCSLTHARSNEDTFRTHTVGPPTIVPS
jgi:hypothetical protein